MLSLAAIGSAGAATNYYARDNYYASDGEALQHSYWAGRGAAALGLKGKVEKSALSAILNGRLPDGRQLGRVQDGAMVHAPGVDATFSAPKSVSVIAEMLNCDDVRDAHRKAVQTSIEYAEKRILQTRIYNPEKGRQELVGDQKAVAAVFEHSLSRAAEPALHSHVLFANVAIGDDDRARSLQFRSLFQNKMLLGAIYRTELAANLRHLGFEIRQTHRDGRFELKGFPEALKKAFSTRRSEIEQSLDERGLDGAKDAARAALMTRSGKTKTDASALRDVWRERAAEIGQNVEILAAEMQSPIKGRASGLQAREAVSLAIAHLSERTAAFREQDLMRQAIGFGLGKARVSQFEREINTAKKEGKLLAAEHRAYKSYLTTQEALNLEKQTLALARGGRGQASPLANRRNIDKGLMRVPLNDGQRAAARLILSSIDRTVGVQGLAGTGKTTMLASVAHVAKRNHLRVLGLAPSALAARTLNDEAKIDTMTLQKFLAANRNGLQRGLEKTVLILDESSMASTRQMHDLLAIAEKGAAMKLVLVGDEKQIAAIDAGRPFSAMQRDGMSTAVMSEIMRQRSPDQRAAVEASIDGKIDDALSRIDGFLIETPKGKFAEQAARSWLSRPATERANTLIIAQTHKVKSAVTEIVRSTLKREGRLKGPATWIEGARSMGLTTAEKSRAETYAPGHIVQFNRTYKRLGITKGDRLRVASMDADRGVVSLESADGKARDWSPSLLAGLTPGAVDVFETNPIELMEGDAVRFTGADAAKEIINGAAGRVSGINGERVSIALSNGRNMTLSKKDRALGLIDHDYVKTAHSAQGQTSDEAILVTDSNHPFLTTQQSFYVGLSRARNGVTIITDDRDQLQKTLERNSGEKIEALDILGRPDERSRDGGDPHRDRPDRDTSREHDKSDEQTRMEKLEREMTDQARDDMNRDMQRDLERDFDLSR